MHTVNKVLHSNILLPHCVNDVMKILTVKDQTFLGILESEKVPKFGNFLANLVETSLG